MKRRDLLKKLAEQAKAEGLDLLTKEGGSHTKVSIGNRSSVVPRHNEVNEVTAKAILKQMGVEQ